MRGIRVTGGTLRGRRLRFDTRGEVRPTSERARQAYFDVVANLVPNTRFLDLFAGSGVFSFEAVSRGASEALALDISRRNISTIDAQAREWDVDVRAETNSLPDGLRRLHATEPFALVYADPPYAFDKHAELIEGICTNVPLMADSIIAIEHRTGLTLPASRPLNLWRTNRYGNVSISFFDVMEP